MTADWVRAPRAAALVTTALATTAVGGVERALAPDAKLWDRWTVHDPASTLGVDHSAWEALLRRPASTRPNTNAR